MLDDQLKSNQLAAYLEREGSRSNWWLPGRQRNRARHARAAHESSPARSDRSPAHRRQRRAQALVHLQRAGATNSLRFAGLPLGHEFTSLVLALLWTGGHPPKVEQDVIEQVKALDGDFNFEVYMSLSCHNCPDVVQALSLMAILNPKIKTTVIEGGAFRRSRPSAKSWPCPWCS